jgi:hypothetical protein
MGAWRIREENGKRKSPMPDVAKPRTLRIYVVIREQYNTQLILNRYLTN